MFCHHSNRPSGSTHGGVKESRCYVWNPSHITLSALQTHMARMLSTGIYAQPSGANPSDTSTMELVYQQGTEVRPDTAVGMSV